MDDTMNVDSWAYKGARALVLLHGRELRRFVETWKTAKTRGVSLAGTGYDPCTTLEDVLVHVLHWAREYLVWSCDKLDLPDPACAPAPAAGDVARLVDSYVAHLLEWWKEPFRELPEDEFVRRQHLTPWDKPYVVEAMLEHAVVHPMRHRLQLEELMDGGSLAPGAASGSGHWGSP